MDHGRSIISRDTDRATGLTVRHMQFPPSINSIFSDKTVQREHFFLQVMPSQTQVSRGCWRTFWKASSALPSYNNDDYFWILFLHFYFYFFIFIDSFSLIHFYLFILLFVFIYSFIFIWCSDKKIGFELLAFWVIDWCISLILLFDFFLWFISLMYYW